jgi:prephenate dehydrogenase
MARDICLTNTNPLLAALDSYITRLKALRQQIMEQDVTLEATFSTAKDARDRWLSGQSEM